MYPPLQHIRKHCTSSSEIRDNSSQDYIPSEDSNSSFLDPQHCFNLRPRPTRRVSSDTSIFNFSTLSNNSAARLSRQHVQPLSSNKQPSRSFHNHILHQALKLRIFWQSFF